MATTPSFTDLKASPVRLSGGCYRSNGKENQAVVSVSIFICSFYRQIRLEMISLGREVRFGRSVVEKKVSEGFRFSV